MTLFCPLPCDQSPLLHGSCCFSPPPSGDRCGDGQGWEGPLRAVGHVGWEDGVFPGDAEQPWRGERHGGQTEDSLSNPQSQRGVEEEPSTVSTISARQVVHKPVMYAVYKYQLPNQSLSQRQIITSHYSVYCASLWLRFPGGCREAVLN